MRERREISSSHDIVDVPHPKIEHSASVNVLPDHAAIAEYLQSVGATPEQIGDLTITLEASQKPRRFMRDPNNLIVAFSPTGEDHTDAANHLLYSALRKYAKGRLRPETKRKEVAQRVGAILAAPALLDSAAVMSSAVNSPNRTVAVLANVGAGFLGLAAYGSKPKVDELLAKRSLKHGKKLMEKNDGVEFLFPRIGTESEMYKNVTEDDVGGMEGIKERLEEIAISFTHPEIMAKWDVAPPKGVLFYGEAGVGKTMMAHVLARKIGAQVLEVDCSEIYDMWVGSSGKNLKKVFKKARQSKKPVVLLFNEIESMFGHVGNVNDSGGQEHNAVGGLFKAEAESLPPHVLLVGTTNYFEQISAPIVRSGRFDHKIYFPRPTKEERKDIVIKIVERGILRFSDIDPEHVTEGAPSGFSQFGEDINAVEIARATDGMTGADIVNIFKRVKSKKGVQEARNQPVNPISQAEILAAIREFQSSG